MLSPCLTSTSSEMAIVGSFGSIVRRRPGSSPAGYSVNGAPTRRADGLDRAGDHHDRGQDPGSGGADVVGDPLSKARPEDGGRAQARLRPRGPAIALVRSSVRFTMKPAESRASCTPPGWPRTTTVRPRPRAVDSRYAAPDLHLLVHAEDAAGFEHPSDFREHRALVRDVHSDVNDHRAVEGRVGEVDPITGGDPKSTSPASPTRSVSCWPTLMKSGEDRSIPTTGQRRLQPPPAKVPPMPHPTSSSRVLIIEFE